MTGGDHPTGPDAQVVRLEVRRTLKASPERLFAAWTDPDQLTRWWGPSGVTCPVAEVDLRAGGRYRIANRFADGKTVWIVGEFEVVAPPRKLVYSWRLEPGPERSERVTVTFEPRGEATEIVVVHERIPDAPTRDQHEQGWVGCLDGLARYLGDRAGQGTLR
jgi:uncharacterized protein YndB with AHSA1/START domain